MSIRLRAEIDAPTERLILLARGAGNAGLVPTGTAKTIVQNATAVRQFAGAWAKEPALAALQNVRDLATAAGVDDEVGKHFIHAVELEAARIANALARF